MDAGLISIGTSNRAALADGRHPEEQPMDAAREDTALVRETHIHDLPDECLLQILRCLGPLRFGREHPEHWINKAVLNPMQCALVSKRWSALANLGVDSLSVNRVDFMGRLVEAFARWRCLRRLDLGRCYFSYSLKAVLQSASSVLPFLQVLRLGYHNPDLENICAQIYSLPHLTALELKCSQLPPLNNRSSNILRTLELVRYAGTELEESLCLFTGLESLSVEAADLAELPPSIGQLSLLASLHLQCPSLTHLPTSIAHLSRLTYLRVNGCSSLSVCPDFLWNLRALRALIWKPNIFPGLPIDLHQLPSLKDLRAAEIQGFEGLPESMGDLRHLSELELSHGESASELPSSLFNVSSLQKLTIRACDSLHVLPADIGGMTFSLRGVDLTEDCGEQTRSPPATVRGLNKLKILNLVELPSLATLPEALCECSSLTSITISSCISLQDLPQGLGRLGLLQEISIIQCSSLTCLPSSFGYLPMLQLLMVSECSSLRELPETLCGLTTLEELLIGDCPSLVSLPKGLGALEKLQLLVVISCPIKELPEEIGNLNPLKRLTISDCPDLLSLPPSLGLRSLEISDCFSLREFPERTEAPALETIWLYSLSTVSLSSSLGSFKSLKSLSVVLCTSLTELPESLGELRALEMLKLKKCSSLASLPESLGSLGKLTSLEVTFCPLRELPGSVGQLTSLEILRIDSCPLVSLPRSLGDLANLRELSLVNCEQMSQVPDNVRSMGGGRVLRVSLSVKDTLCRSSAF